MRVNPAPALLEQWYRDELRPDVIDISSSGVPSITLAELRRITGITFDDLDEIVLGDGDSLGSARLRAALSDAWGDGDPDRVMIGQGSNEVIALLLRALFERGDHVLIMDPLYHAYASNLMDIGCRITRWHLRAEDGFEPDLEQLRRLLSGRPRGVILNLPHNPTGVTVSAEQQAAIVDGVRNIGAYLIWDAAFAELVYEAPPLADVSLLYDRGFSIGTFSKAFGLPGLRLGWCIGPASHLIRIVGFRDATTLFCSPLMEFLGAMSIAHRVKLISHSLALAAAGRRYFLDWATDQSALAAYSYPSGGVTSFVSLVGVPDTWDLSVALSRSGTLVVPGRAFGSPGFMRVGYGTSVADLSAGLDMLIGKATTFPGSGIRPL